MNNDKKNGYEKPELNSLGAADGKLDDGDLENITGGADCSAGRDATGSSDSCRSGNDAGATCYAGLNADNECASGNNNTNNCNAGGDDGAW